MFSNLLWLILWPNVWLIWENIPCVSEETIYSALFAWSVLYAFVRYNWFIVLLSISLLIFFLLCLSIIERGIENFNYHCSTSSHFIMINSCQCFTHFGAQMLDVSMFIIAYLLDGLILLSMYRVLLCLIKKFWLRDYFIWYLYSHPSSLSSYLHMVSFPNLSISNRLFLDLN